MDEKGRLGHVSDWMCTYTVDFHYDLDVAVFNCPQEVLDSVTRDESYEVMGIASPWLICLRSTCHLSMQSRVFIEGPRLN